MDNNYQYCESKDGERKIVDTDRWYLLELPVWESVVGLTREEFFEKELDDALNFDFPGLYLLIDSDKKKIYVGESSNVKERANNHPKIEFDKMILLWDGRHNKTSHFGNETFRKTLEKECIKLFEVHSDFDEFNKVKEPKKMDANIIIQSSVKTFKEELKFLLNKYGLIEIKPDTQI